MKKLALIILSILLIHTVHATCEYVDIEQYTEMGPALCLQESNTYYAKALISSDFVNGTRPSFTVTNPNNYPVKAFFNYSFSGDRSGTRFYGIDIKGKDSAVLYEMCYTDTGMGNCSINPTSINYFLTEPRSMDPCVTAVPMTREACNKPCTTDADCSEAKCNIAGFCGPQKVVPCPDGKTNCNDIACLVPGQKTGGESYLCKWECKSNVGDDGVCKTQDGDVCQKDVDCLSGECNAIQQCGATLICPAGTDNCKNVGCYAPATRKYNEPYLCEWECKSDRGFNGVCQISTRTFSTFIASLVIIFVISFWYFRKIVINKQTKQLAELKEQRKEIEKVIQEDNEELNKLEGSLTALSTKELDLKRKVDSAEGDVKRALEEQLEKQRTAFDKKFKELEREFNDKIAFYQSQLESIESQLAQLKNEEKVAREKIKTAKGQAKADWENAYAQLQARNKSKVTELEQMRKDLQSQEAEIREKEEELQAKKAKNREQSYEVKIENLLNEYKKRYETTKVSVFYRPDTKRFYIKFSDDPTEYALHRYVYYKEVDNNFKFKKDNREVHHIDYDQLNNESWNLIAITKGEHDLISHAKIRKGDWESGIRELKDALDLGDESLPKHIREHIKHGIVE